MFSKNRSEIDKNIITIFLLIFFSLNLTLALFKVNSFNDDNFFQFAHARELLKNGFTTIEPLTIHSGLNFIYPQWLFAVLINFTKSYFGNTACMWLIIGFYIFTTYFIYKLEILIINNKEAAFCSTLLISTLYASNFLQIRPQVIDSSFIIYRLYLMEKFARVKDKRIYAQIGLISILFINIHNSLWIFLFLIDLCYIAEFILDYFLNRKCRFEIEEISFIALINIFAGFFNPYGYKSITYIFSSMLSIQPLKNFIGETSEPTLKNSFVFFLVLLIISLYIIKEFKNLKIAHIFLALGTSLMALSSYRNISLFYLAIIPILAKIFKDIRINTNLFKMSSSIILISFFLILMFSVRVNDYNIKSNNQYQAVDWFAENYPNKNVKIFSDYNLGSYLEYKGYHPYMDTRAEIYGIENNLKFNYNEEYIDLISNEYENGNVFFNKYNFDYIFSSKVYNYGLDKYLKKHPAKFTLIYTDQKGKIFKVNY